MLANPKSDETIATVDVDVAFLQSNKWPKDGRPNKYVKFRNPITRDYMIFRQLGSLYGEKEAALAW